MYIIYGSDRTAGEIVNVLTSKNEDLLVIGSDVSSIAERGVKCCSKAEFAHINEKYKGFTDKLSKEIIIVIFASDESGKINIDAQTLLDTLEIKKMLGKLVPGARPRIIAEMMDERNEELFRIAGVNEIIPVAKLMEKIIVQMIYNHGLVSGLIFKILSRNDRAYISTITIKPNSEFAMLEGKTYDMILEDLYERDIQLVAIQKDISSDDNTTTKDNEASSGNFQDNILKNRNISEKHSGVIINPNTKEDNDYRVKFRDSIIVLRSGN